ncbi:hypothetical protein C5Y96_21715 [Blastopirellula marina]|uniref:Uncharacterized protein n=1 Tax=Blastopirellula marina TaxID=124 RepID=A0A2S8F1Q4_9BACT|nr:MULTISPECIES: hypothetical protein [Pirellulaceae]PQO26070.1 hypothetical protein C5Y96_21715 [Blastopirellula marina]RCS44428.1 hypothetical protein DTL36_21760 [Bremerella cremea]
MNRFNLRTFFVIVAFIALMFGSFSLLPQFPRLKEVFSVWVLSGCWIMGTLGAFIPVVVKQRFCSNRFWYALMAVSFVGTWSGFWLLYFWCLREVKRSPQYPGLGALLFLGAAAIGSGVIAFVVGWFVPRERKQAE